MQDAEHPHHHPKHGPVDTSPDGVIDPVCNMTVTPGKARGGTAVHQRHEYWFCNPRCRERFIADPGKFLAPAPAVAPAEAEPST